MERRYAGGFFVAVDFAQRVILLLNELPELRHALEMETDMYAGDTRRVRKKFRVSEGRPLLCPMGDNCFALQWYTTSTARSPPPPTGDEDAARFGRDVARLLVLYLQKRPGLVHALYAHALHGQGMHHRISSCELCKWKSRDALRCNYCNVGACTTCVSEASYRECAMGCCRLCYTCYPLLMGQGCDAKDCKQLYCTQRTPHRCQDQGCHQRLCLYHSQAGNHNCDGKRFKRE